MESLFGQYLFMYDFDDKGKKGYYVISGDTRDYVAQRYPDPDIDIKLFPERFDFGKMNDKIVECHIENHVLYNNILNELQIHLKNNGIKWGSHYSEPV
ncbi:MAG: hypothetical protein JNK14_09405 [Chitinophagaceae bacterium]|nr:hypothetical protein [Chitinophagaceae bacterium]